MKSINKEYEILNELEKTHKGLAWFKAKNIKTEQLVHILLIKQASVSVQMLKHIDSIYEKLKCIDVQYMRKVLAYDFVHDIDGHESIDNLYIIVFKYIEYPCITESLREATNSEILDVLILNIKLLNYLLLKGIHWNYFNVENVFAKKDEFGRYRIFLRDPITAAMLTDFERFSRDSEQDNQEIDTQLWNFSFKDFGKMYLSLLTRSDEIEDLDTQLSYFKEKLRRSSGFDDRDTYIIMHILEKLSTDGYIQRALVFSSIIDDINANFGTNYKQIFVDSTQNISMSEEYMISTKIKHDIEVEFDKLVNTQQSKQFLFVNVKSDRMGNRLILDIDRRFALSETKVFEFFSIDDEDYTQQWLSMFRNFRYDSPLVDEFGGCIKFLNSYEKLLLLDSDINEQDLQNKEIMQIITIAAEILSKNVCMDLSVVLFYNFSHLNSVIVYTIYYAYFFINKNRVLMLAFCENEYDRNVVLRNVRSALIDAKRAKSISSEVFDINEIERFLCENLFRKSIPHDFLEFVHQQTEGNVHLLHEFIEAAIHYEIFVFDPQKRIVEIDDNQENWKKCELFNRFQNYNIEDFKRLSKIEQALLRNMSAFILPQSEEFISNFMHIAQEQVQTGIAMLMDRNILTSSIKNGDRVYEIRDKLLKNLIYEEILSPEDRFMVHNRAEEVLNPKLEEELLVLSKHFQMLGDDKSLRRSAEILIKLAQKYHSLMDYEKAYQFYESALIGISNITEKFKIYLIILNFLHIQSKSNQMFEISDKMYELIPYVEEDELLISFYGKALSLFFQSADFQYESEFKIKLKEFANKEFDTAKMYYSTLRGRALMLHSKYREALSFFESAIKFCKRDEDIDFKAYIYRLLGLSAFYLREYNKSIEYNENSLEYANKCGDIKGQISAINNIATIYTENVDEPEYAYKALELYRKNLALSQEYKVHSIEILSLVNLASLYDKLGDSESAYNYSKLAFFMADDMSDDAHKAMITSSFILFSCSRREYLKAYSYYQDTMNDVSSEKQIINYPMFYQIVQILLFNFRDFVTIKQYCDGIVSKKSSEYQFDTNLSDLFGYFCDIMVNEIPETSPSKELKYLIEIAPNADFSSKYIYYKVMYDMFNILYVNGMHKDYPHFIHQLMGIECEEPYGMAMREFMVSIMDNNLNDFQVHIMKSYIDQEIDDNESIQMQIHIAVYYMQQNRIWEATTTIMESIRMILSFMRRLPAKFHKIVFECNYYSRPFHYLAYFEENFNYKDIDLYPEKSVSFEELDLYIYRMDLSVRAVKLNLAQNLLSERKRNNPDYLMMESIVSDFGDDSDINLNIIMNYIMQVLRATEAYLCVRTQNSYEPMILLKNATKKRFDEINLKVALNKETLKRELHLDLEVLYGVLSLPIYIEDAQNKSYDMNKLDDLDDNPPVILVFATQKLINHFNDEVSEKIIECLPMISLFVEDYFLKRIASEDRLTKVLTRRYLENELVYRLIESREVGYPLSILIFDLDNFKKVNDTYGHLTGDFILKEMADIARSVLKDDIKLGRYGGEEFVAVLPRRSAQQAYEIAEEFRKNVEIHEYEGMPGFSMTVSIGVSELKGASDTLVALIERADEALYKAKSSGKNQTIIWSSDLKVKKNESDLAKEMVTGNSSKDSTYSLAFMEMLSGISADITKEERLFKVMSKILELLDAYEITIVKLPIASFESSSEEIKSYSLIRGELNITQTEPEQRILNEISNHPGGFYKIDWDGIATKNEVSGLTQWNSVMGMDIVENGEQIAQLYLKSNLREKEFNRHDLKLATIFSTFLTDYI